MRWMEKIKYLLFMLSLIFYFFFFIQSFIVLQFTPTLPRIRMNKNGNWLGFTSEAFTLCKTLQYCIIYALSWKFSANAITSVLKWSVRRMPYINYKLNYKPDRDSDYEVYVFAGHTLKLIALLLCLLLFHSST